MAEPKKLELKGRDGERLTIDFVGGAPVRMRMGRDVVDLGNSDNWFSAEVPAKMLLVLIDAAWCAPGTGILTTMERRQVAVAVAPERVAA